MSTAFDLLQAQRRIFRSDLPARARLTALALCDFWSRKVPQPYPSVTTLAACTGLGRDAVMRAIGELRAAGAIGILDKLNGRKHRYDLAPLMTLPAADTHQSEKSTGRESPPVEIPDGHRSENATGTGRKSRPEGTNVTQQGTQGGEALPSERSKGPGTARPKRQSADVALPHDWVPSDTHRAFAAQHGLQLELEAVAFRGHFEGRTARSWSGRFSTWLANQAKWNRERGGKRAPLPQRGVIDEQAAQSWGKAGAAELLGGVE